MRFTYILLLSFLFSLMFSAHSNAQKNVTTKIFPDGTVAFIDKYKFTASTNDIGLKTNKYDITLLSVNDTVSITSTVVCNSVFKPDSVSFAGPSKYGVEKIYVAPKGKKWVNRLRFYLSMDEFRKIASSTTSPILVWHNGSNSYSFNLKDSEWSKQQQSWQHAIYIIDQNR